MIRKLVMFLLVHYGEVLDVYDRDMDRQARAETAE